MPYSIEPNGDGTYKVVNAITRKVHAESTTKEKAEAQVRVMEASENGTGRHTLRKRS